MPATVILKLCLTFVFVAALLYRWTGRAGILLEFIFTPVWGFDGLKALLGLYFYNFLLYIHVFLFLMHLIIWRNCSKLQAVRHAVVELLHTRRSKVQPRIGHEGPKGEKRDSSNLSLTSALDGCGRLPPRPGRLTPGKDAVSIVRETGWAPGTVSTGA